MDIRAVTDPPCALGTPQASGKIRSLPGDFRVVEVLEFEPHGIGEHVWLRISRSFKNTQGVANDLAKLAGIASSGVGYAGMKDKNAISTQWFSVALSNRPEPGTSPPALFQLSVRWVTK